MPTSNCCTRGRVRGASVGISDGPSDELVAAAQPLPPDGDDLEPREDSKWRKRGGDGIMDLDGLVTAPEVVESASQAVEVTDVVCCAG